MSDLALPVANLKLIDLPALNIIDYYNIYNSDNNIIQNLGYGTCPAYNPHTEPLLHYSALYIFYIESIIQSLLVIANIGWIAYVWIFK